MNCLLLVRGVSYSLALALLADDMGTALPCLELWAMSPRIIVPCPPGRASSFSIHQGSTMYVLTPVVHRLGPFSHMMLNLHPNADM